MNLTDISNEIAELKDKVSNLQGTLSLPMPAEFHVKQMKVELSEIEEKLKNLYVEMADENPWE